jgi:hypothetical protein
VSDGVQVDCGLIELCFDFCVIVLLDSQRIFHIVDYLVCAVKLFERVLVGEFLTADLFSEWLDFADVFLEVATDGLHWWIKLSNE